MASILPLIFSFFICVSCGKHAQKSSGNLDGGKAVVINSLGTLSQLIVDEDVEALKKFKAAGGDLEAELSNGRVLLTEACFWLKFKVIVYLVENKVSLDKKDREGKSAIDYGEGDIKIKRALFPELMDDLKQKLILAVKTGQLTELKKILSDLPPLNIYLEDGETLLTYCVKMKLENVLRLLTQPKLGLDLNLKNKSGESALLISRQLKHTNIEKLLIRLGAKDE